MTETNHVLEVEHLSVEYQDSTLFGKKKSFKALSDVSFKAQGGEVLRSGCCWYRGQGRVFYFSSGHETYPVYYQAEVRRILLNAARWAGAGSARKGWPDWARNPEPLNQAP